MKKLFILVFLSIFALNVFAGDLDPVWGEKSDYRRIVIDYNSANFPKNVDNVEPQIYKIEILNKQDNFNFIIFLIGLIGGLIIGNVYGKIQTINKLMWYEPKRKVKR